MAKKVRHFGAPSKTVPSPNVIDWTLDPKWKKDQDGMH